jgi:hypothetical protein
MKSLWERLDAAFAAAFLASMGEEGEYTTDVLAAVSVNETWEPDKGPYPRLILWSIIARPTVTTGGGGRTRAEVSYPYMAVALCQGSSYAETRATAQTLWQRMIETLGGWGAILAAAQGAEPTSTERASRLTFERGQGGSGIEIRGRQGSNQGVWRGLAIVAFTVDTTI